jgi:hypothetical protein
MKDLSLRIYCYFSIKMKEEVIASMPATEATNISIISGPWIPGEKSCDLNKRQVCE